MKITIIEDDIDLADSIEKKLVRVGYNVSIFNSKSELLSNHKLESDVYIIDLNLWKSDTEWFEIINWLKKVKNINSPIIITSGYSETEKKIYWLDIWADDYLSKPYFLEELLARIRAVLRRDSDNKSSIIKYKNIEFDLKAWNIISPEYKKIKFTNRELMLIEFFMLNKNKIIPRNDLTVSIWWSYDWIWVTDNTINVTFYNLRKKLWKEFNLTTLVWKWFILKD